MGLELAEYGGYLHPSDGGSDGNIHRLAHREQNINIKSFFKILLATINVSY
jgi:hypothetical protein